MFNPTVTLNIKKEKLESLIASVRKGVPIRIALEKASIPPYYYYSWLKLYTEFIAEKEREEVIYNDLEELEPKPYYNTKGDVAGYYYTPISIIDTIKKCHAEFIESTHDKVVAGVRDKWQSAAWLLERRCKQDYGKEEQAEETKTVKAINIKFVDPKSQQDRLEALEKEVKDNVGSAE